MIKIIKLRLRNLDNYQQCYLVDIQDIPIYNTFSLWPNLYSEEKDSVSRVQILEEVTDVLLCVNVIGKGMIPFLTSGLFSLGQGHGARKSTL